MLKYVTYKIFVMMITLWVIVTAVFFMMKALPGSPFDIEIEKETSISLKHKLEMKYGLDKPLISQYIKYAGNIIKLDLGVSYKEEGVKVTQIINRSFKYSAIIGLSSIIVSISLGLILGGCSACSNFISNKAISAFSTFGIAMPNFILAFLFVYLFGEKFRIISISDINSWGNYIGPILILSVYPTAFITRIVKVNMIKTLRKNYISVLRAYGVSEKKILFKYAFKDVLLPVITYIAPMISSILMGSFAVEKIFSIPGLGKVFIDSVLNRDYYVVFGLLLFYVSVYLVALFIADICYFVADPRLKLGFVVDKKEINQ